MKRRQFLRAVSVPGAVVMAGCTGDDGSSPTRTATATRTDTATATPTETTTGTGTGSPTVTVTETATRTETATTTETATKTPTETTTSGSFTVTVEGFAFSPVRARVAPGTTVTWVNEDGAGHNVVSKRFHDVAERWNLKSSLPGNGGQAMYTFGSSGIYQYFCSIHGQRAMCGAVLVGDVSLDRSMPCE